MTDFPKLRGGTPLRMDVPLYRQLEAWMLERGGWVVRRQGRGTFVNRQKIEQPAGSVGGFFENMRRAGLAPSSRPLSPPPTSVGRGCCRTPCATLWRTLRSKEGPDAQDKVERRNLPAETSAKACREHFVAWCGVA